MNITRRTIGGLALGAIAALASNPAFAEGKGKVYFLIPDSGGPFYPTSAKVEAKFLEQIGYELTVLDATNKSDLQLNQLDNVINLKPKAIIVAAVDYDAIVPGIEKAKAAGIPVIAFDREIKSTKLDFTSVAGTLEIGRIAGDETIRLLKERKGAIKGKVLQIMGDPGDSYSISLGKGFAEKMTAHPEISVITKPTPQWEPTTAGSTAQDQLLANPDIDLIFYHSGYLASAVVGSLEAAGKKPGDILCLDGDGDPGGLAQIRAGWQQVAVGAPMYAQVLAVAEVLDQIVNHQPLKAGTYQILGLKSELTEEAWGPNMKIPGNVVTKANVDDPVHWANGKVPDVKVTPLM
ncbi:MAG: sugar ABC transporter substrate-binding protein [Mesorhizobium sp.]|uniref:sugar ABC transporter substrate-binding protein n=1 Tax=Mesorhizobium sp. TaxID=1871066 RepID=UPI000FE9E970|nr:sugar ABC transporter substrate-binding protein [Mesorhizobium sp.]RWB75882.1 MAG: sugar ABC transporter substrate-binding protein [Mesorhizobium sp.]